MDPQIVRLTAEDSGATAEIAVGLGMNCFSWISPFAEDASGEKRELLWAEPGFAKGEGKGSHNGIPLLAPFPGRIANAQFEWEGETFQLEANNGPNAIHGFALRKAWRITEQSDSAVTAEFQPSQDDPASLPMWPSDYVLSATYRVAGSKLVLGFSAENVGERAMPFAFGTHAYFKLPLADGADVEQTMVFSPSAAEWKTDQLIPTGEQTSMASDHPLNAGAPLAGREFDTPFQLAPGTTSTLLVEPKTGRAVRQSFDESMTCCVIYTPGHREAICLEPYTCVPDPIALTARGIKAGLITLQPGEKYQTTVTLEAAMATP